MASKFNKFINSNEVQNIKKPLFKSFVSSYGFNPNLIDDETEKSVYWTAVPGEIEQMKYFKFTDFRSRREFNSRRQDGANAALNGVINASTYKDKAANYFKKSYDAAKYYAASQIDVGGAYRFINLSTVGTFGYGWGDHGTPPLIKDFTLQTEVATTWTVSDNARWRPKVISKAFPFRGDKVNVIDFGKRSLDQVYAWKPSFISGFEKLKKIIDYVGLGLTKDFVKFYFTGPTLHNGNENDKDDIIAFRAIITSMEDSFSAGWEEARMIGRADPNYYYTGFGRSLQLGFNIYATSRDEVKPIWRKLNALAGYTAPKYGTNTIAPTAPWLRMTIGDLFIQQPILIDSVSYTLQDSDTQWEINIENDPEMKQVPIKISVSLGIKVITDYLPENGGQFYTLSARNDAYGSRAGTDNWLSDTTSVARANTAAGREPGLYTSLANKLSYNIKKP